MILTVLNSEWQQCEPVVFGSGLLIGVTTKNPQKRGVNEDCCLAMEVGPNQSLLVVADVLCVVDVRLGEEQRPIALGQFGQGRMKGM